MKDKLLCQPCSETKAWRWILTSTKGEGWEIDAQVSQTAPAGAQVPTPLLKAGLPGETNTLDTQTLTVPTCHRCGMFENRDKSICCEDQQMNIK